MARRDTIDVWVANLDELAGVDLPRSSSHDFGQLLSDHERERASAIHGEQARARWVAARATLRLLAAETIGIAPEDVGFEVGELGKPRFAPVRGRRFPVCFNLSHSGPLAVYAFAVARELGVDVELRERRRENRDEVALARRLLGEPIALALEALPPAEREDAFLRAWTDYEARVKCLGLGIGVGADPARAAILNSLWSAELQVGAGAVASIAAQGGRAEIQVHSWER